MTKITAKDNTVSAVNQMINSSEVSFFGNENAKKRILVVGNSITRHGPKADIGWHNDWGMAASAPEKDYVHRLFAMLTESGQDVYMRVRQAAYWELNFRNDDVLSKFEEENAFQADIVIYRLGENIPNANAPYLKEALEKFIAYICPKTGKTLFTTCFWDKPGVDEAIKQVAKERGETCVNCGFFVDAKNMALGQFEHKGVAAHPSDVGMEEIAKAIFNVMK